MLPSDLCFTYSIGMCSSYDAAYAAAAGESGGESSHIKCQEERPLQQSYEPLVYFLFVFE